MRRLLSRLRRDDEAATAVEYAIMLALILIAVMTAINAIGSTSSGIWATDTSNITSAIGGS
ncbi:Flp family type IVb pilin [Aquisphaera insulae]|uniref:Flp family type IVb pilin n=1 Tax=Aquisphaera insulae TaxID=2712864 RepID=UPI00196AAE16|nr:Flp family type IVb pilin [Aquisphaera insulae]